MLLTISPPPPFPARSHLFIHSEGQKHFVLPFERHIEEHPDIRFALIGGSGFHAPVLLLQLSEKGEGIDSNNRQQKVLASTQPLLARISDMNKMKKKGKKWEVSLVQHKRAMSNNSRLIRTIDISTIRSYSKAQVSIGSPA